MTKQVEVEVMDFDFIKEKLEEDEYTEQEISDVLSILKIRHRFVSPDSLCIARSWKPEEIDKMPKVKAQCRDDRGSQAIQGSKGSIWILEKEELMENKELLEKFKSIVEGTDVKEIYGYYNGESDEGGVDDWDYVTNNSCPESNFTFLKIENRINELFDIALEKFLGDAWYNGHDGIAGTISYNAPNEKYPNGVLTISRSVKTWTQLPEEYIHS